VLIALKQLKSDQEVHSTPELNVRRLGNLTRAATTGLSSNRGSPEEGLLYHRLQSRKTIGIFMTFLSETRGGADVTAMWLIQTLCPHYNVTLVTTSQFDLDFFNRFAGTELNRNQFHIRRVRLLPTPSAFPMSAIQGSLFQRAARGYAGEFDICLSAMNTLDFGVSAVHFIADYDRLIDSCGASKLPNSAATRRNVSALRRLYYALSARIQNASGRDMAREDIRLHQNQRLLASAPNSLQRDPEQSVGSSKPRLRTPPAQNGQLLPQRQVFQDQISTRAKTSSKENSQEPQKAQHKASLTC